MIENVRKYPVLMIVVISFYYLVGIIGLANNATETLFKALVPFTLLLSLYFLWLFHEEKDLRFYVTGLAIFILGYFIEAIGVNTGVIFGDYEYGQTLGFEILDTPLMIGVNWLLLVYSCWALTGLISNQRWLRLLIGASLMVIYDIALEPVAIRLDMWNWKEEDIPLLNYTGWFLSSMILFFILDLSKTAIKNKIAPALFIIQFLFFIILNIVFHYL
jgi:bisanhydrobacterioruberin hydratase